MIWQIQPGYAGINYERLETFSGPARQRSTPARPFCTWGNFPAQGEGLASPVAWQAPHEWPNEEYPYLATTGRNLYHYHSEA